eukprot:TRINITY_DN1210_c0_g1_i1.p1 TRINITY_DN1210_c0_g1~~TRINITY_DN1210_c0_g1_i1.p1  ORF type:complete len:377 (+),score=104.79 TRINITY_DN1210_c0_g1_i1:31-1161(+)
MAELEPRNGVLGPEVTQAGADEADARGSTTALTLQCDQNLQNALAPPSTSGEEVDASPAVLNDDSLITVLRGQASTLTSRDSLHYDITGYKKAIIFNHKKFSPRFDLNERRGTELDVKAIEKTFSALKWKVEVCNDYTCAQIREAMSALQTNSDTNSVSALAVFILSHGEDNGTVFAQDSMYRVDHDILYPLAADKCPLLAGKPKLIFVQACQGKNTDPGIEVRRRHTSQDSASTYKIPNYSDFLIFQASFWDHYSFRSSETGSWFIQALCTKINDSCEYDSLMDTLLEVSRFVSLEKESNVPTRPHLHQKKQTPLLYSTLLRRMYLKGGEEQLAAIAAARSAASSTAAAAAGSHSRSRELMDTTHPKSKPDCICM